MYFLLLVPTLLAAVNAIYNGKDAPISDFPHQVMIEYKGRSICGGSIISENWIVTTYNCANWGPADNYRIRAGSDTRGKGGSFYQVDKIVKHDKFSILLGYLFKIQPVNDIALMRVEDLFVFGESIQPIELLKTGEKLVPNHKANVTGFRWLKKNNHQERLQWVEVPIMDLKVCNEKYEFLGGVPDGYVCSVYRKDNGRETCFDEQDGSLVVDGRLAGLMSSFFGCYVKRHLPVLYTDIGYYRRWIDQQVQIQD